MNGVPHCAVCGMMATVVARQPGGEFAPYCDKHVPGGVPVVLGEPVTLQAGEWLSAASSDAGVGGVTVPPPYPPPPYEPRAYPPDLRTADQKTAAQIADLQSEVRLLVGEVQALSAEVAALGVRRIHASG